MSTSQRTQSPDISQVAVRCIVCRKEFVNPPRGLHACPNCGCPEPPQDLGHDVVIRLNWKDVRVLAIWADEFVRREGVKGVYLSSFVSLLDYLRRFQPKDAPGLTLYDDAEEGRRAGHDVYVSHKPWGES